MTNVIEYWTLLDSLKFQGSSECCNETERVKINLEMLKAHIPILPVEISRNLIEDLKITHLKGKENNIIDNMDQESQYCIYTLYVLREIYKNVHFDSVQVEDLISETHKSMLMASIDDVVEYGLKSHLHSCFYKCKSSVFPVKSEIKTNFYRTELMIETFSSICHMPAIRTSEETILCYMAAIFSLFLAADLKEYDLEPSQFPLFQSKLNRIWTEISKVVYYRNLMILYGIVHPNQKSRIHKEMLLKLWSSGGFVSLLFALQNSEKNREDQPIAEIVEKLVANPSYSKRAQQSLEQQIFLFLTSCINNKDMLPYMGVGVACLRKLYNNNDENKELVKSWIQQKMQPLLEFQEDRITVMEWVDFTNMINLMFQIFCTSTVECMPSDLLICYLPVLIACHNQISIFNSSNHNVVCGHISSLVLRILNNRSKNELEIIIKNIITNTFPKDWFQIHPNITFEEDTLNNEYLRIIQKDSELGNTVLTSYMSTLTTILKNSSFTTLTYQVFIILFRLLPTLEINESSSGKASSNSDLLLSEDDIENRVVWEISRRYNGRIQVISALQILNEHKPLKNLIIENIKEILVILQEMLNTFTKTGDANAEDFNKSVIIVLLTLIREIVENAFIKLEDVIGTIEERLTQLTKIIHDKNLKYQILCLQKLIQTKEQKYENNDTSKNRFEDARVLIESKESYIQVEGIEKLIKLIKENDEFTVNNVHVVTALALNTLKSSESYTFLNCVRLFVSLVNINEHVILETLADDYLNESSPMDYRLLVGEALLRVCKEIGPLCYKYKALLLNAYMYGCRSALDEFRFSSFSNLAQMCKILSFQVQNFFQELLHLINIELTTGKYIPSKRAAVMVLSDLLAGMDNLMDYEEMLLPIYRLLKYLSSSECTDEKIRLHASVGLENISVKCKELLRSINQQAMEKEIKILGIKDNPKRKLHNHILYMN